MKRHKKVTFKNIILSYIALLTYLIVLLIMIFSLFSNEQKTEKKLHSEIRTYKSTKNNYENLKSEYENKEYPITLSENSSEYIYEATKELKKVFTDIYTYKDGKEYETHRDEAKQVIKDQSFFEDYLKNDKDDQGKSSVDILKLNSKAKEVLVYATGENDFKVLVSFSATNGANKKMMFDVEGNNGNYTSVQAIKGFQAQTNK